MAAPSLEDNSKAGLLCIITLIASGVLFGSAPSEPVFTQSFASPLPTSTPFIIDDDLAVTIIPHQEKPALPPKCPYTGLGTDYCVSYSDGPVSKWVTDGKDVLLQTWKTYGYPAVRVGFEFGAATTMSTLDYDKFDDLLEIFDAVGIKVIPVAWDDQTGTSAFLTTYQAKWVEFANHYMNDTRIAALSLFNEPSTGVFGGAGGDDAAEFTQYASDLVDAVHAVDPDRVCIMPWPGYMYTTAASWITDLTATGILAKSYVIYDVVHPYYFENGWDQYAVVPLTPEAKAAWYASAWISPCVTAFTAAKCYAGETFAWIGENTLPSSAPYVAAHTPNASLQKRWMIAILNQYDTYGISFCVWQSFPSGSSPSKWTVFVDAEDESTYHQNPYTVVSSTTSGGTVSPSGSTNVNFGSSQAYTAAASEGYYFNYWEEDGAVYSSTANPLTYSGLDANSTHTLKSVFAQYTPIDPQVYYVEAYAGQGGSVSPSGQTIVEYPAGHVDLTATANYGYTFSCWLLNGTVVSFIAAITYSAGIPPNVYVFTAEFTADPAPTPTYTITSSAGANGSITNSGVNVVNVGTAYTSLATADVDYIFSHWTRAAVLYSTANPISLSLSQGESATLVAVFIEDTETPPDPVEPEPTPEPAPPTPSGRFNEQLLSMERQMPFESVWEQGTWTPGTWDECREFRKVTNQMEKKL